MIAIVDYKAGNLASVKKAFDHLGHESAITSDPAAISRADKIVLPGVGNFEATTALAGALQEAVVDAIDRQVPLLGICLGMQWMFDSSREAPQLRGLGLFAGECEKFPAAVKSPHVGWNQLQMAGASRLLHGLVPGFVRVFHPLLPGAGGRGDGGQVRVWRGLFRRGGTRTAFRSPVSPGKIRDGRASSSAQFL